jgi:hypothetical protein
MFVLTIYRLDDLKTNDLAFGIKHGSHSYLDENK